MRELIAAFEQAYGQRVPVSIQPPRQGDVAGAYANADKAARLLGWKAELPITEGHLRRIEVGQAAGEHHSLVSQGKKSALSETAGRSVCFLLNPVFLGRA